MSTLIPLRIRASGDGELIVAGFAGIWTCARKEYLLINLPKHSAVVVISLLLSGCGNQPELEFADWVFPVPEGTPIKEYAPVPMEERTEIAFELVEDLVIGGEPGDPNTTFYRPIAILASDNGNIFVVENGGARVQMFGPDGEFLKTLGKRGQGPGEFQMPMTATISGDRLVVLDIMSRQLSVWTDDGEFAANHAIPMTSVPSELAGITDGRLMALATEMDLGQITSAASASGIVTTTVLAAYSTEGEQLERLMEAENPPMVMPGAGGNGPRARIQSFIDMSKVPRPSFVVGSEQIVYVTPSSEYQVLAMTPEGQTSWALRVPWPRRPASQSSRERLLSAYAQVAPESEIKVDDFDWPEFSNAISRTLRTDGQGRLYVSPSAEREESESEAGDENSDQSPRDRPVDVYSADGELIVAGLASGTWSYARGDFVYRLRSNPDTDETQAIRYRLIVNPQ